jgi:hypothetical protein
MTNWKAILLAAAAVGGLSASAAAMPLNDIAAKQPNLVQDVRMICNEFGRCYETHEHWYRDRDEPRFRGRARVYGDDYYYDRRPGVGLEFRFR